MARHKDTDWNLPDGEKGPKSTVHQWQSIHTALLMDIRDELKQLNTTLGCFRVRRGMDALHRIDRRLAPRRPLKQRKKA
jgi:hypothetical protein